MEVGVGHRTAAALLLDNVPAGGLVVDAGAFPGTLTRELSKNWQVIALDVAPERPIDAQIAYHRGTSTRGPSFSDAMGAAGVRVLKSDIERDRWPIDSESVDAVVLTEVIEHLYVAPLHTLLEANRILKPDGVFLVSTPNLLSIRGRVSFALGNMDGVIQRPFRAFLQKFELGHIGHVRLYAASELEEMLHALGFSTLTRYYSFDFWAGTKIFGDLAPKRPLYRRIFKTPRNYLRAAIATTGAVIERLVPSCREHMFVIARKKQFVSHEALSAFFRANGNSLDALDSGTAYQSRENTL